MDCLFCKIAQGEVPATTVYEDSQVIAFKDISPQAPHHIVIIPRKHVASLNDIQSNDSELMGHIIVTASNIAKDLGMAETGYRLIANCNDHGGQTVFHIHFHLLGGRQLNWPPG